MSAEFVWRMEDVLDVHAEPFDARRPTVCFDEQPYQLVGDVLEPMQARPGRPRREDYEYERNGYCNLFIAFEPHSGWRHVDVTARRTSVDFARQMKELVDEHYPQAEVIRVVLDNLSSHTPAALYQTFPPEEARRITRKLQFHYTPKHGSWLNMAEIELSVLSRQCIKRRIPNTQILGREIASWEAQRNEQRATINWRFTTSDARIKLHRLYQA